MAITIRGTAQSQQGAAITHAAVSGVQVGDVYLDIAHNTGSGIAPALDPTYPFTDITTGTDGASRTYRYGYRVATGAETSLDVAGPNYATIAIFSAFAGVDNATPIESIQMPGSFAGTTATAAASTPTADNCWHILVYVASNDGSITISTPPSGYTQLETENVSGQGSVYVYYKDLGAASSGVSTGTKDAIWTGTALGVAGSFILRPASTSPSDPAASSSRFTTSRHTFGTRR